MFCINNNWLKYLKNKQLYCPNKKNQQTTVSYNNMY